MAEVRVGPGAGLQMKVVLELVPDVGGCTPDVVLAVGQGDAMQNLVKIMVGVADGPLVRGERRYCSTQWGEVQGRIDLSLIAGGRAG